MLKAPFPWFGGKSRISDIVWRHFGDVPNYVEPFAGSLAVLLGRPHDPNIETVNDLDCYIANFWRALQAEPEKLAEYADYPVNEADLHARHDWLVGRACFRTNMHADPFFYDVKIAGWWLWGISQWIGSGWCNNRYFFDSDAGDQRKTTHRQKPNLSGSGMGIHRRSDRGNTRAYMRALADRLRYVRVTCGDWNRVLGYTPTTHNGVTGVFLDPPYEHAIRDKDLYACESNVSSNVREWAIENGKNTLLRIALCGYDNEHAMPEDWHCVEWKTSGGYGLQSENRGRDNAIRERIWFSPHCVSFEKPIQELPLFLEIA